MNKKTDYGYETRLLTIEGCCAYLGVGKNKAAELAKAINAVVKLGGCTRYDKKVIDKFIDSLTIHNQVAEVE